jgi:hypothetical protein
MHDCAPLPFVTQVQAASRELEVLRMQLTTAEAAASGHKQALAEAQQRHAQQLAR